MRVSVGWHEYFQCGLFVNCFNFPFPTAHVVRQLTKASWFWRCSRRIPSDERPRPCIRVHLSYFFTWCSSSLTWFILDAIFISWRPKFQPREAHHCCWRRATGQGLCKQMESRNRANAQRCHYFIQQLLVWHGDLESCIDTAATLLHQAFRLHKANWRRLINEQGSGFHILHNVWDQKIFEDFLVPWLTLREMSHWFFTEAVFSSSCSARFHRFFV